MSFVHLHVHTEFSLLDGACRIRDLPGIVKAMGQTACAVTDHGVMYGAVDFYRACKAEGVKPIIGCEVYVTPQGRTRFDKVHELDAESRHLVLLCENEEGYRNLSYLVSMGWTEGFYIKPRIDLELLRQYSGGLIALSACLAGEIPRRLRNGEYENAKAYALELSHIFGPDRFYLELQDHGIRDQAIVNQGILRIHRETGLPMVCTNDAHYLRKEDAEAHDVLLCIQTGKTIDDENRMRYEPRNFYLRSEEEMAALFAGYEGALENTSKIADMCNLDFSFGKYHLPEFRLPEGYDSFSYLKKLCDEGYRERYGTDDQYRNQLRYEQDMIEKMGFTDYFLIVSDFVRYARSAGIPVGPGRGSAAGSMVSYCLHITDIDPMKYNLYFERFLNPERVSMPDIDMDFGDTRRGEVVDYVRRKYGDDHVAQIVTFGTMAARGVIRDVGRVMNMPYADVDVIAKQVPAGPGALHITLDDALRLSKPLREQYETDEQVKKLIDTAKALEGMPRHASTHAAGVVITKRPVYEYVPLAKNDDAVVCQYVMTTLEELGLLKMDFLGLKTLSIIKDAVENIRLTKGVKIDIDDFTIINDPATYRLYGEGRTVGTFQFESAGMQKYLRELQPSTFEDLIAMNALYRPGPMDYIPDFIARKHGRSPIEYDIPVMEKYLKDTYGITVYQEQVMLLSRLLANFTRGESDTLRKAMGKKLKDKLDHLKPKFIEGGRKNGHDPKVLEKIWGDWEKFASYAFNKSHATCYSWVAYQTAYLKANYPSEYMAAVLSRNLTNIEQLTLYMNECKRMGISVMGPDINESMRTFSSNAAGDVRFGLAAVKGVGAAAVESIIAERKANGPFKDIYDFVERVNYSLVNRKCLENLAYAGAFDSISDFARCKYFGVDLRDSSGITFIEQLMRYGQRFQTEQNNAQQSLFGGGEHVDIQRPVLPACADWSQLEKLTKEREMVGLYLSAHPLDDYKIIIDHMCKTQLSELENLDALKGQEIAVAGMVVGVQNLMTKTGKPWGKFKLEDYNGGHEFALFGKDYENFRKYLFPDYFLFVRGRVQAKPYNDKELEFKIISMVQLQEMRDTIKEMIVQLPIEEVTEVFIHDLTERVRESKGDTLLRLNVYDRGAQVSLRLFSKSHKVSLSQSLVGYLDDNSIHYSIA